MNMQDQIIDAARSLIMHFGYNGFSYADVADAVKIRKASTHHYFPAKSDLAKAVVQQVRLIIQAQTATLAAGDVDPVKHLRAYTAFWERCIGDGSAPFCVAGMLAAEMTSLPPDVAEEVKGHFQDLSHWLETVLSRGASNGQIKLRASARIEAEGFISMVYGAMLTARAYGDTKVFAASIEPALSRLLA
jgi:TetR/AcrR family transcriptional regulator, transcriptional repressor for nem operon